MTPPLERLDDFRQRTGAPAVIAAIVERDGTLQTTVVGSRRRDEPDNAATVDDQWHIGSCGKSITAALYGCLVEAGQAEWGVPISALFPDLTDIDTGWTEPTIDDLFHCRAGVAPNPSLTKIKALWASPLPAAEQRHTATEEVLAKPPKRPGRFRYSNLGYVVVGAAIDQLAGVPFEEALQTHVLGPLGIESLGFGAPPAVHGHRSRLRLGPFLAGAGRPVSPDDVRSDNPLLLNTAGRMHLTVADWATFHQVFLREGEPLLRPDTISHLLAPPPGDPHAMSMGWAPAHRLDGASYAMQGSNTMWVATAVVDDDLARTSMVIVNDGRTKMLRHTAVFASELLA